MLLIATLALAGPKLPTVAERGAAIAFGAAGSTSTDLLVDAKCTGTACEAIRQRSAVGGFVQGQFTPWIGAWASAGSELSVADAALLATKGLVADTGIYVAPWAARPIGATVWGTFAFADAGQVGNDLSKRWQLEAGAAARFGKPSEGLVSWLGVNALIVGNDSVFLGADAIEIPLSPLLPGELVGGVSLVSNALRGFGSSSRLFLTMDGSVGARTSFSASLGLAL